MNGILKIIGNKDKSFERGGKQTLKIQNQGGDGGKKIQENMEL